jgi:hypothetical protein
MSFRAPVALGLLGFCLGTPALAAGQGSDAAATPPKAAANLPPVKVVRVGRAVGHGDSVPFPARKTRGVTFAASILEGRSREDGFLDTARSADGRRLWVKRGTDDGDESGARFDLESPRALPAAAVLQLVDGFTSPDPGGQPGGLGSAAFKRGAEIRQQHFEAWLALPKERVIVRPADQSRYPLVPVAGAYDDVAAAKAQWVVFVSKCKETGGACVYYGPPAQICSRSSLANEADGLQVFPAKCPSPPSGG